MQYLLLIYDDEKARWTAPAAERDKVYEDYKQLVGELVRDKIYLGGNQIVAHDGR